MKSLKEEKKNVKQYHKTLVSITFNVSVTYSNNGSQPYKLRTQVFNQIRVNVLKRSWMENFNEKEQHSNSLESTAI